MTGADRMPPHSAEAEQALLGGLLLDNQAWGRIAGQINESDFFRDDHRRIFAHIRKLIEAGEHADVLTVSDELGRANLTEQTGGLAYLGELANAASPAGVVSAARIVRRDSDRRRLIAAAREIEQAAATADPAAALAAAEARLAELRAQMGEPSNHGWPEGSGDISAFLTEPPPPIQWFVRDRLLAGRAHLLTGIGGSSKTRLLFHLGIAATIGRTPWGWEIERAGAAALFLAEDTAAGVHRTLAAIVAHSALSTDEREEIARHLRVFPLAGKDTRLLAISAGGALTETPNAAGLIRRCNDIPHLKFIGLDPALALTEGNELDNAHQRRLGEFADRLAIETGACVVLVSHAAKALQNQDEIGSHSSRGGGAITDAVRGEFTLRTMTAAEARQFGITDLEERKSYVQLVATKGNELPPSAYVPLWLKRGHGGVLELAGIEPQAGEAEALMRRDTEALAALRELNRAGSYSAADWKAACVERRTIKPGTSEAEKKAMQRISRVLLAHGLIERAGVRGAFRVVAE